MSMFRRRLLMQQALRVPAFPEIPGLIARYSARGLTNEEMAKTNVWKDLTGNGHDITLHNFAWSGASGYGGYSQNFNRWGYGNLITMTQTHTSDKIELNVTDALENIYSHAYDVASVGDEFNFSIKVTGLQDPCTIRVTEGVNSGDILTITQDGTYDINATIEDSWDQYRIYFFINNRNGSPFDLTIEQVPLYPNALVSDGVDDYGICENFPILTKEKGYTVVALRKWLDVKASTPLLSNSTDASSGAFIIEESKNHCGSFGAANNVVNVNDNFVYQTSTSYNGQAITQGDDVGTNILNLFRNTNTGNNYSSAALYDLLIYNRDLTEEEINQLRDYFYIRDNQKPLDSSLVDAWIFSGYKNEDAPDTIAGVNGIELTCNNFAWNEEGSGFKDGALWFDGVNDFLYNSGFPVLTDYTIIVKREHIKYNNYAALASKYNGAYNGAFLFENSYNSTTGSAKPNSSLSFGNANTKGHTIYDRDQVPDLISWQTKDYYNGYAIGSDNIPDGEYFSIAALRSGGYHVAAKVYWVALYSVSLTETQIQAEIQKLESLRSSRLNN